MIAYMNHVFYAAPDKDYDDPARINYIFVHHIEICGCGTDINFGMTDYDDIWKGLITLESAYNGPSRHDRSRTGTLEEHAIRYRIAKEVMVDDDII